MFFSVQQRIKKKKNDGCEPQISTDATKVNYLHQEESDGELQLPSPQEPKTQVVTPIARE